MTILTPTYAEHPKTNGATRPHVAAAHEPTREGEQPTLQGTALQQIVAPAPAAAPLKVALIGTAPSSRMLAPFHDPSWKIWACSPGNMNALPRVDVWFELHSNLLWPEHESYGRPYIQWLNAQSFPVYMQDQSLVPRATVFPKDELVAEFKDRFFTSSFAWMMALAMKEGATEIALYGIDMASRDEYIRQRPGFFFFQTIAEQRGIKVSAPHESDIMQSPALYAYVDSTPFGRKIMARRQEVSGRINAFDQQIGQASNSKTYLQGALEDLDYFESIWSGVCNDMGRIEYENRQLKAENEALKSRIAAVFLPPPQSIAWTMSTAEPVTAASFNEPHTAPASKKSARRKRRSDRPEA
jgi:hypothetical protein